MGQAHGGIGLVNMLTTSTRGAVGIGTNIRGININLNIVVDLWGHIHRRKRRMATIAGIEWRLAHQPMHTNLRAQPAKGILTTDLNRGTFNTRHITGRAFHQLSLKPFVVCPTQIHAQQHLSPVLRLSAARARLNFKIGVILVHLTAKHAPKLELC